MQVVRKMDNGGSETKETLMVFGGAALVMLGAGMMLSTPVVKRYLGGLSLGGILANALPDIQKYLQLKAM